LAFLVLEMAPEQGQERVLDLVLVREPVLA
jgi:hypothetical protein